MHGLDVNSESDDNLSFSKLAVSRHTTRDFLPTPVPKELINQLIQDALATPSWSNTRPFKIAIAESEVKDRISAEFLRRWSALSRFRNGNLFTKLKVLLRGYGFPTSNRLLVRPYVPELKPRAERVGKELYEWIGIARGDRKARDIQWGRNYEFFGAPTVLFVFVHKSLGVYAGSDAGLMMQNLVLSAHARGLGTCLQGAVIIWDDVIRKEFDISKNYRLLCGIAIGYPSDAKINDFKAHRLSVDEILIKPRSKNSDS
jgi:nitroreductase